MNNEQLSPGTSNYSPDPVGEPRKGRKIFWAVGAVVVILLVGYFVLGIGSKNLQEDEEFKYEATMQITANGFVPSTLTVRPDTRVYFESKDGQGHQLVPNDTHNDNPAFAAASDQGSLRQAGGYAYSFHHKGTYSFHDADNPTQNGQVIVE